VSLRSPGCPYLFVASQQARNLGLRCVPPDGWHVCAARPYALAPSQARAAQGTRGMVPFSNNMPLIRQVRAEVNSPVAFAYAADSHEKGTVECIVLRKFGMEKLRGVMPRLGIRKDALFGSIANYHPPPQILPPGEAVRCRLPDGWLSGVDHSVLARAKRSREHGVTSLERRYRRRARAARPYALAPSQARAAQGTRGGSQMPPSGWVVIWC
jgi:hypothetical protein